MTQDNPSGKPRFETDREIRFQETDSFGHAHFSTYIRLMEETEYAFLRSRGLRVVLEDDRGTLGFPRISADIKIQKPARFEERVWTTLELTKVDGKQIIYHFEVVNEAAELVCLGEFAVACCRFPADALPYAVVLPEFIVNALR